MNKQVDEKPEIVIKLLEIVGSALCIASEDGEKVYDVIRSSIEQDGRIRISFEGVEDLTSAFLNAAIGQLYGKYSDSDLKKIMLPPIAASPDQLHLLKRVVERAKSFFKDPQIDKFAVEEIAGED
jgi:hypothetical protein